MKSKPQKPQKPQILHIDYDQAEMSLLLFKEDYPERYDLFQEARNIIATSRELDLYCQEQCVQALYDKDSQTSQEQAVLLQYEQRYIALKQLVVDYNKKVNRLSWKKGLAALQELHKKQISNAQKGIRN